MIILRFCISQMDVPARQAYVSLVVASEERSAAGINLKKKNNTKN